MQTAAADGADYVFISPVFEPKSKASTLKPIGVDMLALWIRQVAIPVFALGGITKERLQNLSGAGCAGVAGISMFVDEHGLFTSSAMQS
jgi:thiamine monophosphate synthase